MTKYYVVVEWDHHDSDLCRTDIDECETKEEALKIIADCVKFCGKHPDYTTTTYTIRGEKISL